MKSVPRRRIAVVPTDFGDTLDQEAGAFMDTAAQMQSLAVKENGERVQGEQELLRTKKNGSLCPDLASNR
jgi:hypothetical protein